MNHKQADPPYRAKAPPEQAVHRELFEETGLTVSRLQLFLPDHRRQLPYAL